MQVLIPAFYVDVFAWFSVFSALVLPALAVYLVSRLLIWHFERKEYKRYLNSTYDERFDRFVKFAISVGNKRIINMSHEDRCKLYEQLDFHTFQKYATKHALHGSYVVV